MERWLQRIAALTCIWLMANAVDQEGTHWWLLWSFLAIALVLEVLAFNQGMAAGIQIYKAASPKQRKDLDKIMESKE